VTVYCECGCGLPAPLSKKNRPERGQFKGAPVRFVRGHAMRGKTLSDEARQKMSAVRSGRQHSAEKRARMSERAKKGADHPGWKGDDIAYSTIHRWISRVATKTGVCSVCGDRRITQWANVSGRYRRAVEDFAEMCVPCHYRYDRARRETPA
jgi:hypothetical protein